MSRKDDILDGLRNPTVTKIIRVVNCWECPFMRSWCCLKVMPGRYVGKNKFPRWCPLPDAPEEKEGKKET